MFFLSFNTTPTKPNQDKQNPNKTKIPNQIKKPTKKQGSIFVLVSSSSPWALTWNLVVRPSALHFPLFSRCQLQTEVGLCVHFSSVLGLCVVWTCEGPVRTVIVSVSVYVRHSGVSGRHCFLEVIQQLWLLQVNSLCWSKLVTLLVEEWRSYLFFSLSQNESVYYLEFNNYKQLRSQIKTGLCQFNYDYLWASYICTKWNRKIILQL